MTKKIVVIGGGVAGLSAAQAARETDEQAEITLVCGENCLPYYRARLCQCISGLEPQHLQMHNAEWFERMRIKTVFGRVNGLGKDPRLVRMQDEQGEALKLPFDRLVLATGGSSRLPKFAGSEQENVIALRTLADIERLERHPGSAVVLGDSVLALEAAYHLLQAGRTVSIVGRSERLLPRHLDREGSLFFLRLAVGTDMRVALNAEVERFESNRVLLTDGRYFDADVMVVAAGFAPQISLAAFLSLETAHGIIVDEHMRTSQPDVYACGDCAEHDGVLSGRWIVAKRQGQIAGINAAGADPNAATYQLQANENQMEAMSSYMWSFGDVTTDQGESRLDIAHSRFGKLFFRQQRLVGAEMIGDNSALHRLKKAVEEHIFSTEAVALLDEVFAEPLKS